MLEFIGKLGATHWMILAVTLFVIEIAIGTTYILWVAAAALITSILVFLLPIGWPIQLLVFSLFSVILLYISHKYFAPHMNKDPEISNLNERAKSMVGLRVKAVNDFEAGQGRVYVGDTQWRARLQTGSAAAGQELKIISVDGTTLNVELSV